MTAAKLTQHRAGFSLMEINMAVFVMAVGILGMVALFPLGLREANQGRADLKQSMFADHALNQLTGLLTQPEVRWSDWVDLDQTSWPVAVTISGVGGNEDERWEKTRFPTYIENKLDLTGGWKDGSTPMDLEGENAQCRIFFQLVNGPSVRVMGIGVRSTEKPVKNYSQYTNNVLYYAEVMFQGEP